MNWIKGSFFLLKQKMKKRKLESNLYNAKKHAILALAYWKDTREESDLHFQLKNSSIYVRLGK